MTCGAIRRSNSDSWVSSGKKWTGGTSRSAQERERGESPTQVCCVWRSASSLKLRSRRLLEKSIRRAIDQMRGLGDATPDALNFRRCRARFEEMLGRHISHSPLLAGVRDATCRTERARGIPAKFPNSSVDLAGA